jgi:nucleoid-associated protein YgaU
VKAEEKKVEEPVNAEEKKADNGVMPPDPTNSTVYEVKAGDTLSGISQKIYGNASFSNVIFRANADILKDPNKLRPGMKLIIPNL